MKDFRDLDVWRKAHALALATYKATEKFPKAEIYGLTSQMRRATSSIPANIAEGCGRRTDTDFAHYLQNAFGSANELEYLLLLSSDLKLLTKPEYESLIGQVIEVKKMLAGFLRKLHADR